MTFVESEFGAANSDRQSASSAGKTAFGGQRLSTSEIIPAQANLFGGAQLDAAKAALLESELGFYQGYRGWLNPFPTVGETAALLDDELAKLGTTCEAWQVREVMTNVFLLGCTLLNSVDDYVRGPTLRSPKKRMGLRTARLVHAIPATSVAPPPSLLS